MTQAELAERMRRGGFRWHPATVYKVENGERQIQLAEAIELARIFGTDVEAMTESDHDAAELRGYRRDLAGQRDSALHSLSMLENLRKILAAELARVDLARLEADEVALLKVEANPPSEIQEALVKGRDGLAMWSKLTQDIQLGSLRRKLQEGH
ncbi:hypothetical protein BST11_24350 [Mycobacterium alsense]|nr:hypothetical protein BST11_24350 [Mycobacterium alsense]